MTPLLVAPIALKLWWFIAMAPATIRLQVRIAPVESDRIVVIEIDGEEFYRSFDLPVEGAAGPRTWSPSNVTGVPAGTYDISARVGPSRDRARARVHQTVEVH